MKLRDVIEWSTERGNPITAHEASIIPLTQVVRIQLPFGGFVWNRPTAVLVEREGEQERIPIVDVTRLALMSLFAATTLLWLLVARFSGEAQSQERTGQKELENRR